jgi:molecular chaperone DnaK
MTITGGSALSKDEIDRMVREAEQYAEEDRLRKEAIEARNAAEGLVYSTEKFLDENDEKVPDDVKGEVRADVESLKKALEDTSDDAAESIRAAAERLAQSSQKMGAAMYAANQADGQADAGPAGDAATADAGDDDVVEAEIVDDEGDRR